VAIGKDETDREIKWTEQTAQYKAYIDHWYKNGEISNCSGLHVFAR